MRIRAAGRAFVLGTLLFGVASCGSVASNHPDSGGGLGGQTAADGGSGGSGAGGGGGGGNSGSGGAGAGTGGMSGGSGGATGTGGATGSGIVVHGGIVAVPPVRSPGTVVVVNPRIGGPGPRTCGASACVVRGGIVP